MKNWLNQLDQIVAHQKDMYHFEVMNTKNGLIIIWSPMKFEDYLLLEDRRNFETQEVKKMIEFMSEKLECFKDIYRGKHEALDKQISISHSKGWFAVFISNLPTGIDIEISDQRIIRAKKYFLNATELNNFHTLEDLHIIWGAKEAFYKLKKGDKINDLKEISINYLDNKIIVAQNRESKIQFSFKRIKNAFLVWNIES